VLEALPPEMREEALRAQRREQDWASRQQWVDQAVLEALPPELRAEAVRAQRAERHRASRRAAAGPAA